MSGSFREEKRGHTTVRDVTESVTIWSSYLSIIMLLYKNFGDTTLGPELLAHVIPKCIRVPLPYIAKVELVIFRVCSAIPPLHFILLIAWSTGQDVDILAYLGFCFSAVSLMILFDILAFIFVAFPLNVCWQAGLTFQTNGPTQFLEITQIDELKQTYTAESTSDSSFKIAEMALHNLQYSAITILAYNADYKRDLVQGCTVMRPLAFWIYCFFAFITALNTPNWLTLVAGVVAFVIWCFIMKGVITVAACACTLINILLCCLPDILSNRAVKELADYALKTLPQDKKQQAIDASTASVTSITVAAAGSVELGAPATV